MGMTPRDYQLRVLDETWEAMQEKLNILIVAPCSAGKTILFSKIIQRLLRENPAFRALILVDREILVSQSADKLRRVAPELAYSIGIVCASVQAEKQLDLPVTVASRQSLIGRLDHFPAVQLVIVDEAHLMAMPSEDNAEPDQYAQILARLRQYNGNMRLLGCTASPHRLGAGRIYGKANKPGSLPYWEQIDSQITTKELLAGGYIASLIGRVQTSEQVIEDLAGVAMVAGEYNIGQLSAVMCRVVHISSCIDAWQRYAADRKKTLIFCTTIEHCEAVADAFVAAGITAAAIHSKLSPVELAGRMAALENGTKQVFTSVAKLTTGMDVVDIDCIVMARPTKSTALYQQAIGRGQRLAPGKTDCLIIDLVGCTKEFGTDMDNLLVNIPRGIGGGDAPVKICPGELSDGLLCGAGVHASLAYCPVCGYEFPRPEITDGSAGHMKKVQFNAPAEAEIFNVDHVSYQPHQSKKSEKTLIKVVYEVGLNLRLYEWVCLPDFYTGFAVDKARQWWERRSAEPFPETIEEFMFLTDEIEAPIKIKAEKDGKFWQVLECIFADDSFDIDDEEFPYTLEHIEGDEVPF